MLYFEHNTPSSKSSWSSSVYFRVSEEVSSILEDDDFPINFRVRKIFNDEEIYSANLNKAWYAQHPAIDSCYAEAVTNKGVVVFREDWDPIKHGCISDSMFYLWCLKNPGSKGIAIGSNDGSFGDYVIPFMRGLIDEMTLVEASDRTFDRLKENYSRFEKVTTLNHLVSTDGKSLRFFESTSGPGLVNSVYEEKARFFGEDIKEIWKESVAVNDLISGCGYDLDWLHLDVEGLDEDIVLALDFKRLSKPKVIIYERNKENPDKESIVFEHLSNNGYDVFEKDCEMNRIAILKKE